MKNLKLSKLSIKLNEFMAEREHTQAHLAKLMGTTAATINRWLKGINEPCIEDIILLSNIYESTPNELIGFHEINEKDIDEVFSYIRS